MRRDVPPPYDVLITRQVLVMLLDECMDILKENKGLEVVHVEAADGTFVSIKPVSYTHLGIARAFLHKSRMILLDEPTSNIDSLNEGIILKSLKKEKEGKLILLVSHRKSTMGIADKVVQM